MTLPSVASPTQRDSSARPSDTSTPVSLRTAIITLGAALGLIGVCSVIGVWLNHHGYRLVLPAPPLVAHFHPHVGWGSPLTIVCVLVGLHLQTRCARLPWRRLLLSGWMTMLAWMCSLTLVDGFHRGWAMVLENPNEYLHDLPRITSPTQFLATFDQHILIGADPWTTHVAAHPPLTTLIFWVLDRVGLPGGFWAGALCILIGSTTVISVPIALRALGAESQARRIVPLLALFPGAVWMAVSADGLFAGVTSAGTALICCALHSTSWVSRVVAGTSGGLVLGVAVFLSYGLVLFGVVVLAVAWLSRRLALRAQLMTWIPAVAGVTVVWAIHRALGFDWLRGLFLLRIRYYQGIASDRPYPYFVFADLAAWLVASSPALAIGIVAAVATLWYARRGGQRPEAGAAPVAVICLAAVVAVLLADLSGLSKAETERIWLPFGVVGFIGLAHLTGRAARWTLVGTAVSALIVNHLLRTGW